jgi:hypothetical protein
MYCETFESKEGGFKKAPTLTARPARRETRLPVARPQSLGRAERTEKYVSTAKWRERRWRLFSTLPQRELCPSGKNGSNDQAESGKYFGRSFVKTRRGTSIYGEMQQWSAGQSKRIVQRRRGLTKSPPRIDSGLEGALQQMLGICRDCGKPFG